MAIETFTEDNAVVKETLRGYDDLQEHFDGNVQTAQGNIDALVVGSGLDVLADAPMIEGGFQPIQVDVRDYLRTPQILARVLLIPNVLDGKEVYSPAVLIPKPGKGNENIVRLSKLDVAFVPDVGLTDGILFGTALEAETQAPGFGGHGNGASASRLEPGHLTTAIAAGIDERSALKLEELGDEQSHLVIATGVSQVLRSLGRNKGLPTPVTVEYDVSDESIFVPGFRLPLAWHHKLKREGDAAATIFEGIHGLSAADLLLGKAFYDMTDVEIDRTSQHIDDVTRGVRV